MKMSNNSDMCARVSLHNAVHVHVLLQIKIIVRFTKRRTDGCFLLLLSLDILFNYILNHASVVHYFLSLSFSVLFDYDQKYQETCT